MILVNPVGSVGGEEFTYRASMVVIKVDGLAPLVFITACEVVFGKLFQVIAIRTEVIVDDIENDAHPQVMSAIHETAKIVRSAIESRGREQIYTIVTPAELS